MKVEERINNQAKNIFRPAFFFLRNIIWNIRRFTHGYHFKRHGVKVDIDLPVFNETIQTSLIQGYYESNELRLLSEYIDSNSDVIELGGGVGVVSCAVNSMIGNEQTQITVEAIPELEAAISRHMQINNAEFEIVIAAYAPEREEVEFNVHDDFWGSSIHRKSKTTIHQDTIDIETLIEMYDLETFSLIVDIEGGELDLIKQELHILEKFCEQMIIEWHGDKPELSQLSEEFDHAKEEVSTTSFALEDKDGEVEIYQNTTFNE